MKKCTQCKKYKNKLVLLQDLDTSKEFWVCEECFTDWYVVDGKQN